MQFAEIAPLLAAVRTAEQADQLIDLAPVASELRVSVAAAEQIAVSADQCGLALTGLVGEQLPPRLLHAGEQYLDMRGEVSSDVLHFLPVVIDDLHAREALLHGGTLLVDEFRYQVLQGGEVEHARELVPPAFQAAVDRKVALDLYAACVALMARLSAGEPAGCVGEEIVAVELLDQARSWLEMRAEEGDISEETAKHAADELDGLFELFQDDDVLDMFDMEEPADAAVAGHTFRNQQLGIADQRIQVWFRPFGAAATGYLHESRDDDSA